MRRQRDSLTRWIAAAAAMIFAVCLGQRPAAPAQDVDAEFKPELVAVEFTSREVRPGDPFAVTLKFRNAGTRPARGDYWVFLHFEAPDKSCRQIAISGDHPPSEPTSRWRPGQVVVDGPRVLTAPTGRPDQQYFVHAGIYARGEHGSRLLDSYQGGTIRVAAGAPAADQITPAALPREEVERRRRALAARISADARASLETAAWRLDVDRGSGAWALTDKATGVLWTSDPVRPCFAEVILRGAERSAVWPIEHFDEVRQTPGNLRLTTRPLADGKPTGVVVAFTVEPVADPAGLRLSYDSQPTAEWRVGGVRLLDRALVVTEEDGGCLYVPHRLGIERRAADGFPGSEQWGTYSNLSMAMCGAVKQGSALLVNWDDVDTRLVVDTAWPDLPLVPGRRARAVSLEIDAPQGMCTIHPLGRGGYVEIAHAYRPLARAKGWLQTWADKRKRFPTVDRLFGAVDFKPFVFLRVMPSSRFSRDKQERTRLLFTFAEVAQCAEHWHKDLGIDRAGVVLAGWINGGYDVRHPDVLPAAPECGGNEGLAEAAARIKACGYLFGLHDNYQDMYQDAPSFGEQWLNKDARGVPRKGGNWNGGQAWQVCAVKQVELAARPQTNLPKIAEWFGPTIYFIDTVFAWPLVTCEDPAHPMTRADDLRWKTKLCLLAKGHFGLFGSEEGREWAVPCADYLEGIFTQQTDSPPGSVIPLFPLVYSDCVQIMTHQSHRIGPGTDKKIADHVLFAEMPVPSFGNHLYWTQPEAKGPNRPSAVAPPGGLWARGDDGWPEDLCPVDRVIKNSFEVLSPLNVLTAESPLSSHEFLTPDRLVQRTRFGGVTITVAYEKPAALGDDVVPAHGFIVESPQFIAFCATRYRGIDYDTPTLFTVRSLDGKPIAASEKVRIYHGYGDRRIKLFAKQFEVAREEVVRMK